ncbi:uncharacterized protein RCC_10676 [Ramularia collo-cygni]|uniref:Uncharacterized protein n=1 Tax=Ramularia collo-cygni TaxID=112498 RepID=A0A2D3V3T2_9PEZI|nr:uncharacterized protein RCC_10676 [Ramularia collo-cygni]CZT24947.1 uncharacterized protein RCC_10676 [Ramularia collo-cygni]
MQHRFFSQQQQLNYHPKPPSRLLYPTLFLSQPQRLQLSQANNTTRHHHNNITTITNISKPFNISGRLNIKADLRGKRQILPRAEIMASPTTPTQQGQAERSGAHKRKRSARDRDEDGEAQGQARRATGQNVNQQPVVIDLLRGAEPAVGVVEDRARFNFGTKPSMRKSKVLSFVRAHGKEIILRQASIVLDNGVEARLKELEVLITNESKANILSRCKEDWERVFKKCVKGVQAEVDELEAMYASLRWVGQEEKFALHILDPKKRDLSQALTDAREMAALIQFLHDN